MPVVRPAGVERWGSKRTVRCLGEQQGAGKGWQGLGRLPSIVCTAPCLVLPAEAGTVLWDCVGLLHQDVVQDIKQRCGGIAAMAISHPHFYGAMADWADAFDCQVGGRCVCCACRCRMKCMCAGCLSDCESRCLVECRSHAGAAGFAALLLRPAVQ